MSTLVFVYGSLKRGGCYHSRLRRARYVATLRSAPRFTMLDLGAYPGVIDRGSTAILGELYSINNEILRELDRLEEYPQGYTRRRITTRCGSAWIYLYRLAAGNEPVIRDGNWQLAKN